MAEKYAKKLVLLDAHAILHRAYHALPDFASPTGEPTGALYGVTTFLLKIVKDLSPDYVIACYDLPGPTFRHESYKEYKAGRAKADDALVAQMKSSRRIFEAFNIPIYDLPGFEADDMLGTIVEHVLRLNKKAKDGEKIQVIIASGDMDTLQLIHEDEIVVYTLKKGINDTIVYDEAAVKDRFGFGPELLRDYKGLRGDPSDNIIGISGIGEKTATELIQKFGELEGLYRVLKKDRSEVEKAGIKPRIVELLLGGEEEALFSKILATIRRDAPIVFALPEKEWNESLDREKVGALFTEFGFKSLLSRLDAKGGEVKEEKQAPVLPEKLEDVDPRELAEAQIALSLLDSTRSEPTQEEILKYARTNSFAVAKAYLLEKVHAAGMDHVYRTIELPLIPILEEMEKRGVLIDRAYLEKLSTQYHKELEVYQKKIWEAAGEEFNINSPKQLGEILFTKMGLTAKGLKKTAGGAQSTRESELEKLAEAHPIAKDIMGYRELAKLLGTYIDVLPKIADEAGRVHAHFIQIGAATGRMASRDPGVQNIPIKSEHGAKIRAGFIASPGYTLVDVDYSQIELRVLAMLSGDEKLIKIFQDGGDIHEAVGREVFKPEDGVVTKDMRRKSKVINFGIIYGMGVTALQKNLGSTRAEAQEFYDNYFAEFPGVKKYIDDVKAEERAQGYTETLFGRRRYFPNIVRGPAFLRAAEERMAQNAPDQGTAADILKIAMVDVDKKLKAAGLDAHLLLQVHDELVFEVKKDQVDQAIEIIRPAMENVMDGNPKGRGVPLTVGVKTGKNWMVAEEI